MKRRQVIGTRLKRPLPKTELAIWQARRAHYLIQVSSPIPCATYAPLWGYWIVGTGCLIEFLLIIHQLM